MRTPRVTAVPLLLTVLLLGALSGSPPAGGAPPGRRPGPAAAGGTFTDLGPQIRGITLMRGVPGREAGGRPVLYTVLVGRPARLVAVDPRTRRVVRTVELPGADGAWTLAVGDDGRVYAGSYPNGHLYRYLPARGTVQDLGAPVAGQTYLYGLSAGPGGQVFGGTYPGGRLFRYDPVTGARDLGAPVPGERYVLSTAYDAAHGAVLAGVGQHAHLVRVDPATGRRRELLPARYAGQTSVADLTLTGGRLFAGLRPSGRTVVLDPVTGAAESLLDATRSPPARVGSFPADSRGVLPPAPGGRTVYWTSRSVLYGYDPATRTFALVRRRGAPVTVGGPAVAAGWFPPESRGGPPVLYGLAGTYEGRAFRFDPAARGRASVFALPLPRQPVALYNLSAGADGRIYSSGFLNGDLGAYDPARGTTAQYHRLGQVEGWTWRAGLMYAGTYPGAEVLVYDPGRPFAGGVNPRRLFGLAGAGQSRPVAMTALGGRLYVGTVPAAGRLGGVLAVHDPVSGSTLVRHVAAGQSVSALAAHHGAVWVGTSTAGGSGTVPVTRQGELLRWDPRTGRVTRRVVPVPGARSVLALVGGPGGLLWGLADGTLFAYDDRRGRTVRRIPAAPGSRPSVVDGDLVVRSGDLYGTVAGVMFRADARRGTVSVLRRGAYRIVLGPRGDLYVTMGAPGTGPDLWRYRPAPGARPGAAAPVGDPGVGK